MHNDFNAHMRDHERLRSEFTTFMALFHRKLEKFRQENIAAAQRLDAMRKDSLLKMSQSGSGSLD